MPIPVNLLRILFSTRTPRATRSLIAEPATSLTDMALAAQATYYAERLRRGPGKTEQSSMLWALAFAATALAALAGAVTHAIHEDASLHSMLRLRGAVWKLVGLFTAVASALMLVGSIVSSTPSRWRTPILATIAIKATAFALTGWRSGNFLYTIVDYATSMVAVLYLQVRNWRASRAAPWLAAGVLVSFMAAAIQRARIAPHVRFNHNDLYHVVQMGAFHLLYEGARREEDWHTLNRR